VTKDHEQQAARDRPQPVESDLEISLHRCPFCHDSVSVDQEGWVACSGCLARHHRACWEESGCCGSCSATKCLVQETAQPTGAVPRADQIVDPAYPGDEWLAPSPVPRRTNRVSRGMLLAAYVLIALGTLVVGYVLSSPSGPSVREQQVAQEQVRFRSLIGRLNLDHGLARQVAERGDAPRAILNYRGVLRLIRENQSRFPDGLPTAAELDAWEDELDEVETAALAGGTGWQQDFYAILARVQKRLKELNPEIR
jgi:hypothetical protein